MKILFLSRLFYPHIGGVEKHILEISRLLIKKGDKVTVVAERNSPRLKLNETVDGIEIFRIPTLKDDKLKKFIIWNWMWNNRRLIKNADVIHCHDVFFWYLPFRFLYFSKPIFTTFHGYENYPLKSKFILMHKIAEMLSSGNICVGDFMKKWYKTKPDFISYGGVSEIKNQKSKIKNKNSALFIGRLDEQTGILTYVEAVKAIRKKIPNFDFLVIGDGKLKDKIDKEVKVYKPVDKASKYFKNYNFAFVSRYLSILEAMAARRLVFAVYDNPLKEDYLRMAPFSKFTIISGSLSELVSKISFYLDNTGKKEKIIESAYNWVKKNTWEEMTNTYLKLWKSKS